MNCETCREMMVNELAAGVGPASEAASEHRRNCAECDEFFVNQKNLFASIDAEVSAVVNVPVPPSLLPGLRARIAGVTPKRNWFPLLLPAGAILAAACLVAGLFVHYQRGPVPPNAAVAVHQKPAENLAAVSGKANSPGAVAVAVVPKRVSAKREPVSVAVPSPSSTEVIVLPEEAAAFAAFVANVSNKNDVAVALTRPAAPSAEAPVEIALLKLEALELKPLAAETLGR
jgi:hypothetical protein